MEEALEAAQRAQPGLALWSDGSRLENGRVGAGVAWQNPDGAWKTHEVPMGVGKEVFDAELMGASTALCLALRIRDRGPVTVLLDSKAAIARLQHLAVGPGQGLAIQAHKAAQTLTTRGRQVTIQWVPSHRGIDGNEKADQAAKRAATRTPRGGLEELSIAYTNRTRTEVIKAAKHQWLAKALGRRTLGAQREYRIRPGWKQDPTVAAAPKKLASRYYQLKTDHAAIGPYLRRIQAQESEACRGCQAPKETVSHLLFECREWRKERETLYKTLTKAGVARPTLAEEHPRGRLLGDPRASKAILQFLRDTTIGYAPTEAVQAMERTRRDDEWGLEALEEAERHGEG
jgi:ribonuclease HI